MTGATLTRPPVRHQEDTLMLDQSPTFGDPRLPARFWAKVRIGNVPSHRPELGPCWEWTGGTDRKGYGRFPLTHCGHVYAHRIAYENLLGPIPSVLTIDHLCRNHGCVKVDHLEPVTNRENILRGEGVAAINARKTHCYNGHSFDEVNTYLRPNGDRVCNTCRRAYQRSWNDARRTDAVESQTGRHV